MTYFQLNRAHRDNGGVGLRDVEVWWCGGVWVCGCGVWGVGCGVWGVGVWTCGGVDVWGLGVWTCRVWESIFITDSEHPNYITKATLLRILC